MADALFDSNSVKCQPLRRIGQRKREAGAYLILISEMKCHIRAIHRLGREHGRIRQASRASIHLRIAPEPLLLRRRLESKVGRWGVGDRKVRHGTRGDETDEAFWAGERVRGQDELIGEDGWIVRASVISDASADGSRLVDRRE